MTAAVKRLEEAFENIGSEESTLSMQARFDILGQEIIAQSFYLMERQRINGTRISEEEKQLQQDSVEQFNIVEKVFSKFKKAGRLGEVKPNEKFDEQLLEKIKKKKSTISEIVQMIPTNGKAQTY